MNQFRARGALAAASSILLLLSGPPALAEDPGAEEPVNAPAWVPGEVIVCYRRAPVAADLSQLQQVLPAVTDWRALRHPETAHGTARRPHPLARVRVVKLDPGADVQAAAGRLSRVRGVAYAHPNYLIRPAFLPDDPYFQDETQYGPQTVGAAEAWDMTTGDPGIVIAVVDTGLFFQHEDLNGAIWVNLGETERLNQIDDDGNGFVDDYRGWNFVSDSKIVTVADPHGTHVAGIAVARINNGKGIAGMCNCKVLALQVFDENDSGQLVGTWEHTANAFFYAVDNGADVINYSASGLGGAEELSLLQQAVVYAWENDVPIIAAAGNFPLDPPHYPGVYPETIAVAGTTKFDTRWSVDNSRGSAVGPHLDVAAPADDIISSWTTVRGYSFLSGTSMATPHVTGLVGLMLSINPSLGVEEIRALLHENAVDLGAPGFDDLYGAGRIDAAATLEAVPLDLEPPAIVHDGGIATFPFNGYIDPRGESSDGVALDQGIRELVVTFSEPVRDAGSGIGGSLTADAFMLTGTADAYPAIAEVDDADSPTIRITLSGPVPVGEWTTLVADVEDLSGNLIESLANPAPGADEPDRVDVGFLPGDVDQDGQMVPLDLLRFRGMMAGTYHNPAGEVLDYADIDRNGVVDPSDLIAFRHLISGTGNATRSWALVSLPPRP
jgi:subtilisin family serine protease